MNKVVLMFSVFFVLVLSNIAIAQKDVAKKDKLMADSLKLSNAIATKQAELIGLETSLVEETAKLAELEKVKNDQKNSSQESSLDLQKASLDVVTEKDAKKLKKKANTAQKDASKFEKSIKQYSKQFSKVEQLKKNIEKAKDVIAKNQRKLEKVNQKF